MDSDEDDGIGRDQGYAHAFEEDKVFTSDMAWSKRVLLAEVKSEVSQRSFLATLRSVLRYLSADHARNPRAAKIGICTVFILVLVITMF